MPRTKRSAQKFNAQRRWVLCGDGLSCPCRGWQWIDRLGDQPRCFCGKAFADPPAATQSSPPWKTYRDVVAGTPASQPKSNLEQLLDLEKQATEVCGAASPVVAMFAERVAEARRVRDASKPAALRLKDAEEKADKKQRALQQLQAQAVQLRAQLAEVEEATAAAVAAHAESQAELSRVKLAMVTEVPSAQPGAWCAGMFPADFVAQLSDEQATIVRQVAQTFAAWAQKAEQPPTQPSPATPHHFAALAGNGPTETPADVSMEAEVADDPEVKEAAVAFEASKRLLQEKCEAAAAKRRRPDGAGGEAQGSA